MNRLHNNVDLEGLLSTSHLALLLDAPPPPLLCSSSLCRVITQTESSRCIKEKTKTRLTRLTFYYCYLQLRTAVKTPIKSLGRVLQRENVRDYEMIRYDNFLGQGSLI